MLCALQNVVAFGPESDDGGVRQWTDATITIIPTKQAAQTPDVSEASQTSPESGRPTKKRRLAQSQPEANAQENKEQESETQEAAPEKDFSLENNEVTSLLDLPSATLAELASCTNLTLECCEKLTSLAGLEHCTHLRSITVEYCPKLLHLLDIRHCKNLSSLYLTGSLDNIDFLVHCPNLTDLSFEGFDNITNLDFLAHCPNLTDLSFDFCTKLTDLSGLRHCTQLRVLTLENCISLSSLNAIAHCPLEKLYLSYVGYSRCPAAFSFRGIGACTTLRQIHMNCGIPEDVTGIEEFAGLQSIMINGDVRILPNFGGCHNLKSVHISNCKHLEDIKGVLACNSLQTLSLSGCPGLHNTTSWSHPSSLKELRVFDCGTQQSFIGLQYATVLEKLTIFDCANVETLDDLACPKLKRLMLGGCTKLANIDGVRNLGRLEDLYISDSKHIEGISVLSHLKGLRKLQLINCAGYPKGCGPDTLLQDITPLEHMSNLSEVEISGYDALENIAPLSKLTALTKLRISGCEKVTNIEALAGCTTLEGLSLTSLPIETIEPLRTLINLVDLNLAGSKNIRDITAIEAFQNLKRLTLTGCSGIQDLGPAKTHPTLERCDGINGQRIEKETEGRAPPPTLNALFKELAKKS